MPARLQACFAPYHPAQTCWVSLSTPSPPPHLSLPSPPCSCAAADADHRDVSSATTAVCYRLLLAPPSALFVCPRPLAPAPKLPKRALHTASPGLHRYFATRAHHGLF